MAAKIAIVDDDRVTISMLEKLMTKQGYQVFTALDGAAGLELVKNNRPALLICDMLLPKVHGMDLCKKIKEDPELKKTKIILITAVYKGTSIKSDIKSCGADHYFEKPINTKDLLDRIEKNVPKTPEEGTGGKKISLESLNIDEVMRELESLVAEKKKKA